MAATKDGPKGPTNPTEALPQCLINSKDKGVVKGQPWCSSTIVRAIHLGASLQVLLCVAEPTMKPPPHIAERG
jgi:hypothetical protein